MTNHDVQGSDVADDVQPHDETPRPPTLARRNALIGAGALGVAGVLAACGGDNGDSDVADNTNETGDEEPGDTEAEDTEDSEDTDEAEDEDDEDSAADGDVLVAADDVPEGGGVIIADAEVVVTQPEVGEFRAFSAICTHQSCTVAEVSDGLIRCPCHGSRYFIADGGVENGPATSDLPEVDIAVEEGQILRA